MSIKLIMKSLYVPLPVEGSGNTGNGDTELREYQNRDQLETKNVWI